MASILIGIDDPSLASELTAAAQQAGHQLTFVPALDIMPNAHGVKPPEVLLVHGDAPGMDVAVVAAGWRHVQPRPVLVVLGATAEARIGAERARATFLARPVEPSAIMDELTRAVAAPHSPSALTAASALRVLGLSGSGLPEQEAAVLVVGARHVDAVQVRAALRPHVNDYLVPTILLDRLRARRVLSHAEASLVVRLDGSLTLRRVVDSGALPALNAARLVWALVAGGALELLPEPPSDPAHPRARLVAELRDHVRTRRARLQGAHLYDVLEVPFEAPVADIERACHLLAVLYEPEFLAQYDLGEVGAMVDPLWQQVLEARRVLSDAALRGNYDARLPGLGRGSERARHHHQGAAEEAEKSFVRGQHALASGDVFLAMSELASAARRQPDEPDYEVYAAWGRVCAEEARGGDRSATARRELHRAQQVVVGRRPRPRALFALGLLAEAVGDLDAALHYQQMALLCDPRLTAARQALQRLEQAPDS